MYTDVLGANLFCICAYCSRGCREVGFVKVRTPGEAVTEKNRVTTLIKTNKALINKNGDFRRVS